MALDLDLGQFHEVFFEESLEGLQVMEAGLLGLDADHPDIEVINNVFRAAHSMKGGAGTFGFTEIAAFTHVLETTLSDMRDQKRAIDRELIDTLLKSVDMLRYMIGSSKSGSALDHERVRMAQQALQTVAERGPTMPAVAAQSPPMAGPCWEIRFFPHRNLFQTGNEPYRILRELRSLGKLAVTANTDALPGLAAMDPEQCHLGWNLELGGDYSDEKIRDVSAWVEGDCDLELSLRNDRRHRGGRRRRDDGMQELTGAETGGRAGTTTWSSRSANWSCSPGWRPWDGAGSPETATLSRPIPIASKRNPARCTSTASRSA
jgi:two-component system chemotaxis sensor kinase CheA